MKNSEKVREIRLRELKKMRDERIESKVEPKSEELVRIVVVKRSM